MRTVCVYCASSTRIDPAYMEAARSLGTLLFFRSLSGFLLRVCRSRKKLYYKNLNLFVLRQFNARINTTYRSMTVICLMLLLALGITASSSAPSPSKSPHASWVGQTEEVTWYVSSGK